MDQPQSGYRLIRNRAVATAAFCVTGFVTALNVRQVFFSPRHRPHWLLDLSFPLPHWALPAINLLFYIYLFWLAIEFWKIGRATERFLPGCFAGAAFLSVITNIVPVSTVSFIRYAGLALMTVAFLASLDIFLKMFATEKSRL